MEGVRKEIGKGEGLDRVAGGNQRAQVAGQSCGIAGNIG